MENFKIEVLKAYRLKILFSRHALEQMNLPERMISEEEVKEIIMKGKIIEDYPEDKRGHSCLMKGETKAGLILHVHCAPKGDYLAIITAYPPRPLEWNETMNLHRLTAVVSCCSGFARAASRHLALTPTLTGGELPRD